MVWWVRSEDMVAGFVNVSLLGVWWDGMALVAGL
jgi:hypothetical protein